MILDGTKVAADRRAALENRVTDGLTLGIIVATNDSATASYIRAKEKAAAELGIAVRVSTLSTTAAQDAVLAACHDFNNDPAITAYIVQLPLPENVDRLEVFASVEPEKDADGLTPRNLGALYTSRERILPATPKGIVSLLEAYDLPIKGQHAVIVGKGLLTGLPISTMLAHRGATVTTCDKYTPHLAAHTSQADILITATGHPGLITGDMVKDGVVVIDVGTTKQGGELVGDVDFTSVEPRAGAITPVPGGVGPMTVASLLENVIEIAESRL